MSGSVKCVAGCMCRRHESRKGPCPPKCTCNLHARPNCEPGCTCGRHQAKQRCEPGCTCNRHKAPHNRYTDEQRAKAREVNLAKGREYAKNWRLSNPEGVARERERNKVHGRRYFLKHRYSLSLEGWDALLVGQQGRCYLCASPLNPSGVSVDHDHGCCPGMKTCGKCIRGLACHPCNKGLGHFGDSPARLRAAADALEEAQKRLSIEAEVAVCHR